MNELVFFINKVVLSGAIIGSIYALGAIGVTLVFGILRFAHFAHGDMMTVGAFFSLFFTGIAVNLGLQTSVPTGFLVMPLAMICTALLAIVLDRVFYRPLRQRNSRPLTIVMTSVGITLMLQGLIRLFAGPQARNFYFAESKDRFRIELPFDLASRKISVTEPQILLIVFTAVAVVALHLFLTRSKFGKAMRAVSDNPDLARISGINTDLVVTSTWAIAGMLACAAGTLLALDVTLKPDLSFNILLPIFAATIVGGIGQPYGAVAGGFLIGYAETLSVFNWTVLLRPFKADLSAFIEIPAKIAIVPTEYKLAVPFVILVMVLIWRPTGIFKGRVL